MRIFLTENSPLEALGFWNPKPSRGDAIVYLRDFQDISGHAIAKFKKAGISVVRADTMLSRKDLLVIDDVHDRFMQTWYKVSGEDISQHDGVSIGYILGYPFSVNFCTGYIILLGETIRRALERFPSTKEVITDLSNGRNMGLDFGLHFNQLPRLTIAKYVLSICGTPLQVIRPNHSFPSYRYEEIVDSLLLIIKQYLGGYRFKYFFKKMALQTKKDDKRRVYLFLNHGVRYVASALNKMRDMEVIVDQINSPDVTSIRYDHFLPLLEIGLFRAAARLYFTLLKNPAKFDSANETCIRDFNYNELLQTSARNMLKVRLAPTVLKILQVRKMLYSLKPDAVIINGEGSVQIRAVTEISKNNSFKTIFFRHGFVLYYSRFYPLGYNNSHVTYIANGIDHKEEYGQHLRETQTPRIEVLSNPALSMMENVKGRRNANGKRVLAVNFVSSYQQTVLRTHLYDRYTIELFKTARQLTKEGFEFTYKPHHGDNIEYINYILSEMDLVNNVAVEPDAAFDEVLLKHQVLIVNCSSCLYQALYAGWPVIFFEPDYDLRNFVGLPAASDVQSPIARSTEQLINLVRDAFKPDSQTVKFGKTFNEAYGSRFLGPNYKTPAHALADFIADTVRETSCDNNQQYSSK